jgi:hypothetical protein
MVRIDSRLHPEAARPGRGARIDAERTVSMRRTIT